MLTQIDLTLFKCFERLVLPIRPLTLLSGQNASGKSTVFQALVLLHQTMREHEWSSRLMLNGASIRMGTIQDVVDKEHGRRMFGIGLESADGSFGWDFQGDAGEMSAAVAQATIDGSGFPIDRFRYLTSPFEPVPPLIDQIRSLNYLTAERVGPREVYPLEDRQTATVVGPKGEHTVSVLDWGRDQEVAAAICVPDVPPQLLRQVEARMATFFPGFGMDVQPVPSANVVTLGLRNSPATGFHRPANVGFGLTQVLPIVTALLTARPGDIVIIENPEVHLHPSGQAQIGQFLAQVASTGVQVLIETHSDHVLNGVRRSVKQQEISHENVALHFFRPRKTDNAGPAQIESPQLRIDGTVDRWPKGFFDQFDKDMNFFAGWGE